jgi:hypothetical protein
MTIHLNIILLVVVSIKYEKLVANDKLVAGPSGRAV